MFKKLFKKKRLPYEIFSSELIKKDIDKKLLQKMLDNSEVDINYRNSIGETFLHIALRAKKMQAAIWLISLDIKLDIVDNEGLSVFDIAINNQNHRVVKLILDSLDINLDKKNEYGRTMLQDSVILGDHEMAKILLEHNASINSKDIQNRNVLYDAISYGHKDFIKYLLEFNELELNNIDTDKNTIFTHSTIQRDDNIATMLIEKGANPTILNKDGNSFLSQCALRGTKAIPIIKTSIKHGFDINCKLSNNNTILMLLVDKAATLNKEEDRDKRLDILHQIEQLVDKGLDVNVINKDKETSLFTAAKYKDEEIVKILLSSEIDVNKKNIKGQTILAICVYKGVELFNIISELLKFNADPTIKNSEDKTLYEEINDIIINNSNDKIVHDQYIRILSLLIKFNKKDLNFLNSEGDPLFYKPLFHNHILLFKMYVKAGLDIYKLNKGGHNIFFEYVVKVFEKNDDKIDFQSALSILISSKVNHNMKDETGWTALNKIIATTPCNLKLFKTLVKVVKFDYTLVDKLGRTAIHNSVWKGNSNIVRIINFIDPNIKDIPDNYGILPIVYAALTGNQNLVLTFIDIKAKSTLEICISQAAIKKFTPMLSNLDKLTNNIEDKLQLRQLSNVIKTIKNDFNLEDCID